MTARYQRVPKGEQLEIHETHEQIEHAHHVDNKRAAILIIALAAALAIAEMAGKEAQTSSLAHNIESADLWAFYQAKTIRLTTLRTAIEAATVAPVEGLSPEGAAAREKQLAEWKSTADRLDSDPSSREGRKELAERAKVTGEERDHELRAYHAYEYSSAALQLAIVMASASVITELTLLELVSGGLGIAGIVLGLIGWLAPTLLPL